MEQKGLERAAQFARTEFIDCCVARARQAIQQDGLGLKAMAVVEAEVARLDGFAAACGEFINGDSIVTPVLAHAAGYARAARKQLVNDALALQTKEREQKTA